jgi:hypothetical protein
MTPGEAMQRAAVQNSNQPRNLGDFTNLKLVPSPRSKAEQWSRSQINRDEPVI